MHALATSGVNAFLVVLQVSAGVEQKILTRARRRAAYILTHKSFETLCRMYLWHPSAWSSSKCLQKKSQGSHIDSDCAAQLKRWQSLTRKPLETLCRMSRLRHSPYALMVSIRLKQFAVSSKEAALQLGV